MEIVTIPFKLLVGLMIILSGNARSLNDPVLKDLVKQASEIEGVCLDKSASLARLMNSYADYKGAEVKVGKFLARDFSDNQHSLVQWQGYILDPTMDPKGQFIQKKKALQPFRS